MKILKIALFACLAVFSLSISTKTYSEDLDLKSTQESIQIVISNQLDAFKLRDIARAYSHASKLIKTIFPDPESFGLMVMKSYPMIWDPKDYKYLEFRQEQGQFFQRILFVDKKEKLHIFDYVMEIVNNQWFINGVYLVPVEGTGA